MKGCFPFSGSDPVTASHTTQDTSCYTFDGLGSVSELTDSSQAVVESYKYDSFGNTTILDAQDAILNTSSIGNSYMYTSREFDAETGLYFYRFRYYNSTIGRFVTADPILFYGGINFYTYVFNNPLITTDNFGLKEDCYEVPEGDPIWSLTGKEEIRKYSWSPWILIIDEWMDKGLVNIFMRVRQQHKRWESTQKSDLYYEVEGSQPQRMVCYDDCLNRTYVNWASPKDLGKKFIFEKHLPVKTRYKDWLGEEVEEIDPLEYLKWLSNGIK